MVWNSAVASGLIAEKKAMPGALLPILHVLQEAFGYIDGEAEGLIASALNISRADVHGVVTFYTDFHLTPPTTHVLKICRAEACQSMGGESLAARASKELGIDFDKATADGRVRLETVYCLGLCSVAPSAMLDERIVGRMNNDKLTSLLAEVER